MTKRFDINDWDVETELDVGNDDFIHGNYVEWDRFRKDEEDNLLESFDVYLPWGETIDYDEFISIISNEVFINTNIINECSLDKLNIVKNGDRLNDLQVLFPKRDGTLSDNLVSKIFDYFEVPSGTDYEEELPAELQYWNSEIDYEYELYYNNPLSFNDYDKEIEDIKEKINNTSDVLTKKALLLSAFIITESLLKSVILSKIPNYENNSVLLKKIIKKELDRMIIQYDGRNQLYKEVFGIKIPKQEWVRLRNDLAHNIGKVEFNSDIIKYTYNDKDETIELNYIYNELANFRNELQDNMKL